METIKKYAGLLYGLLVVVLGGLLFNRNRKLQQVQSELNQEKTNGDIRVNEKEREMARDTANELLANYERLKRDD